ncbi:restriction endonuclease subunit S [Olleya marilimosa]|uniref:restriction endonuclease subunit S n=1 Tax=Olleya marilimosa TaxID=272164 RepID=UPI00168D4C6F|nr:restriction endonuclease subunit S [Olleya marilimosa]MBD3889816.1 restriction endonuclease subunit S [Olleya marilimosa]
MKSNYRKIGDFIQLVDIRNKDLKVTKLLGLSISKQFIPSVANIIGTNMANYKIIKKNQFACSTMQVRRDKKMPIALLQDFDEAIISQAYPVFEVIDETILNPEYLMMWFSRSEFDRHACFLAVGGVRGSLEWEDFLDMPIPVPSIEKQHAIVKEYNTIVSRIKLNETLNQKLEDTAQALYKHWFVDFEFPNADGKPYKSSGGEMIYNEELDMEIPLGWEVNEFSDVAEIVAGGDKPRNFSEFKTKECHIPILSNGVSEEGLYGFTNEAKIFKNSITISARGTIGYTVLRNEPFVPIVRLLVLTPKNENNISYIFKYIENFDFNSSGSVQKQLTKPDLSVLKILMPLSFILDYFDSKFNSLKKEITKKKQEIDLLKRFESIILAKMSKVETKTVVV